METINKDPYCNYLFQYEGDKAFLIARHELDVASFYGKRSGLKTEKYYTGEALLEILKRVFTHKKFTKFIRKDEENNNFYKSNCRLLEDEIASNHFNGEHVFTIITNFLMITNNGMKQTNSSDNKKIDDFHLHFPEITQKIRSLFGLKLRPLEKMKSHYLLTKLLLSLFLLIFISLTVVIGACISDWYQIIDFSQKLTILAPFITRVESSLLRGTALLGAADLYQSSIMIIIGIALLILLLIYTAISLVRIYKTEKLDYKVHYLSRIIGESSQKLREIGWL